LKDRADLTDEAERLVGFLTSDADAHEVSWTA
jgi:hypothetical protein